MILNTLIRLCHHRWNIPILAELFRAGGAKFVTLEKRLRLSRNSLHHSLAALREAGWAERNPGYGHPMRPEYILTAAGHELGPVCLEVMRELVTAEIEKVGLNKWTLPVLAAVGAGDRRFSDLRNRMPGISPRALTLTLKDLESHGLIQRQVSDGYPPAVGYLVKPTASKLLRILS